MKRLTNEEYIEKCKSVHGNFYDYSETVYTTAKKKVKIKCPVHGYFYQEAFKHKSGNGCNKCGNRKISDTLKKDYQYYLDIFENVHKGFYEYPKNITVNSNKDTITITCPKHGEFEQVISNHASGRGCNKCGIENKVSKNTKDTQWLLDNLHERFSKEDYDLSKINYVNARTKVQIKCNKHEHWFESLPANLIKGHGCIKCGWDSTNDFKKDDVESFTRKARKRHGDYYSYSDEYISSSKNITITCPKHRDFQQTPNSHLCGAGCPRCANNKSKGEQEIFDFLSNHTKLSSRNRNLIEPYELDIYCKERRLAIEYNGLYWHSDQFVNDDYHLSKTERCKEENINVIHVFEDEWLNKKNIVKSRLLNIIGKTPNKLYGRETFIKEVGTTQAMEFLENNHLQGKVGAKIKLGLYYKNELVSLMTFGELRTNMGSKKTEGVFEMIRFCNKLNTTVLGGASKLFKYFIKKYNPSEVISYADRRWSNGNLYKKLGFEFLHNSKPNYFYTNHGRRENRFNYRKSKLVEQGHDKNKTERQIMRELGYNRVYDCGTLKYSFKLN